MRKEREMSDKDERGSVTEVGMTLKIDPADVSKAVADAVLASEIGSLVKKSLEKVLGEKPGWGKTAIEQAVEQKVSEIVKELVASSMRNSIETRAREVIKDTNVIEQAIQKVVAKFLTDMARF